MLDIFEFFNSVPRKFRDFSEDLPENFPSFAFRVTLHGYPSRNFSQFYLDSDVFSSIPIKHLFDLCVVSGSDSYSPCLIFFLIFYCDSQSPNFLPRQRKSLLIFGHCFREMGKSIPYFLSSHHDFISIFLILFSPASDSSLLFRRLICSSCSNASRTNVVHHDGQFRRFRRPSGASRGHFRFCVKLNSLFFN